ncbi:MAG: hypothetical protein CME70_17005 [Halobacteriovorax sp.]|nr:hypothetical protein [Halobacteriovorax sp.]|tara:strand:+ start:130807 stop:131550 length:744 start_codon:yes stop_codon:yes gene_type:complete
MNSKEVQKRANTKPKGAKKDLVEPQSHISRLGNLYPDKIVGVSLKGFILCSFIVMGAFNYFLLKEMRSMKSEMSRMKSVNAQGIRIILDKQNNPNALERGYFNQKLSDMREEILQKISNIEPGSHTTETIVQIQREPAAIRKEMNADQAINLMSKFDVQKYSVQNHRAYPKFRYFLSEQSKQGRELEAELSDIVSQFAKSNDILNKDRADYHRVLSFKDSVRNKYWDARESSVNKWKRIHNKNYARR